MKKIFIALLCLLVCTSPLAAAKGRVKKKPVAKGTSEKKKETEAIKADGPQFRFVGGDTHDFGVIKRGPIAHYRFEFTNIGNKPLNVMDVRPSCGCTNVDWVKEPVLPGQKGFLELDLKTLEQHGVFTKEVYIMSDAVMKPGETRYTLYIKGDAVGDDPKKE